MGHEIASAIIASAFWIFVAICAVAGITSSILRHREVQKTIRQAIDKGQILDPETLDRLLQSDRPAKGPPPRAVLLFGGIMLLSIAGGIALIGWFMSLTSSVAALYQGLGAASIVGLIGVGLLVANVVIPRATGAEAPDSRPK